MLANCLAVGVGGFIGSILRYLLTSIAPNSSFPWMTLAINVVGTFILAFIAGLTIRQFIADGHLSLLLRVGLCGGFTTLSTFALETVNLASGGAWAGAAAYVIATVVLCVAASFAGTVLSGA